VVREHPGRSHNDVDLDGPEGLGVLRIPVDAVHHDVKKISVVLDLRRRLVAEDVLDGQCVEAEPLLEEVLHLRLALVRLDPDRALAGLDQPRNVGEVTDGVLTVRLYHVCERTHSSS
jgi:hypothetical protein